MISILNSTKAEDFQKRIKKRVCLAHKIVKLALESNLFSKLPINQAIQEIINNNNNNNRPTKQLYKKELQSTLNILKLESMRFLNHFSLVLLLLLSSPAVLLVFGVEIQRSYEDWKQCKQKYF